MAQREGQALNAVAAGWVARQQGEEFSVDDRADLERWLQADPAHAVAFARAEFAWERTERLRAFTDASPPRETAAPRRFAAIAAVVAVVAVAALLATISLRDNVYKTKVGEQRVVALDDGSRINLNTSSRVEIEFGKQQRIVRLQEGEALFKVAHDPQRPFIVQAGGTQVRAVGTAFNVRVRDQVVEVTVTEGIVAIDEDRVEAGSSAVVAGGAVNRVSLPREVVQRRVAWSSGVIELKGETLEQAADEFSRYRRGRIIVADSEIASLRVGGRFETDEADKFLKAMETTFAVRVVQGEDGNTYLFSRQ